MKKYEIELAWDGVEAEEFAAWLRDKGHDAWLGRSTAAYLDGRWTSYDEEASDIIGQLWDEYCEDN